MWQRRLVSVVAFLLAVFAATVTMAQSGNWKKALEQALEESVYQKSKVASLEINNVTEPGTVLVVQKEGIVADRSHAFGTFVTKVKDGQPVAPGGAGGFFSRSSSRVLNKGNRVYLYDVAIRDDAILLSLLTCEMYDIQQNGKTEHTRLKSSVRFEFEKADLAAANPAELKKVFDDLLLPESEASAPKTVALGQTTEEVEAILGKPEKVVNLGEKTIYIYKDLRIVFINGKVADVQ